MPIFWYGSRILGNTNTTFLGKFPEPYSGPFVILEGGVFARDQQLFLLLSVQGWPHPGRISCLRGIEIQILGHYYAYSNQRHRGGMDILAVIICLQMLILVRVVGSLGSSICSINLYIK